MKKLLIVFAFASWSISPALSETIDVSNARQVTVTGGNLTKEDVKALQQVLKSRGDAKAATLHPIRHKILKYCGYYWLDDHVLMPVNNWCSDHSGLVNLGGAAAGYSTTALVGAKHF